MKKIFLRLLIFVSIFILPFTTANAYTYQMKRMPLNNFITTYPEHMYINGIEMKIGNHSGFRTMEVHVVEDNSNIYHGYCLHVGKQIYVNSSLGLHEGFSDLKDSDGQVLDSTRQEVLKNILASGYQNGNRSVDNFVQGSYHVSGKDDVGTCVNNDICVKVLATQILVWEVQAGARSNYEYKPNTESNSVYDLFVATNPTLYSAYTSILNDAKSLSQDDDFPAHGKTYKLKWSDASNKYKSGSINIGSYNVVSKPSYITVSNKGPNNTINVSSNKEIIGSETINVNLTKGQTTEGSTSFRWFKFENHSDAQDILMGDYSVSKNDSFNVKTEKGKFYVSKIDSDTKKILKGSKFNLYKCSGNNCSTKEFIREIDLTTNAQTVEVTINKSGTYMFEETVIPTGYEGLGQFLVEINIEQDDNEDIGRAKITKAYNDFVNIQKLDGSNVENSLVIENKSKEIVIQKVDATDNRNQKSLNGATFQIKDSNNNIVKFELVNDAYRYSKNGTITDLVDPSKNEYTIQLLPQGEYTIIETAVPYPYVLPGKQSDRERKIRITKDSDLEVYNYNTKSWNRSTNAKITIKNFKTSLTILKTGTLSSKLKGVTFELYDSTKTKQIILIKNEETNEYEYVNGQTGNPIQIVTNDNGKATIRYLPDGKYWLKETVTVDGYTIDETNEWTEIKIDVTKDSATNEYYNSGFVTLSNAKNEFSFYKIDEDGNPISDGKFKLQVYNESNSKFEDVSLIYHEEDNVYTIDKTGESSIYVFTPIDGIVSFKDVDSKTKYRVVEIQAPEGFVLPSTTDAMAEIVINENGYSSGNSIMINKKVTVEEGAAAQAELVINISTGQERIRYALIIGALAVVIIGLFILNKKIKK